VKEFVHAFHAETRLDELESRKLQLRRELEATPPAAPRFHPRLSDVYRDKVSQLHDALAEPQNREEAIGILRGLIEKISVRPTGTGRFFEVELVGEIANMVALSPGAETAQKEPYRSSVRVVAGEGFEPLVPLGEPSVLCADLARVRSALASSLSPQED
jgi:hypothetical protein